jgi:hypothetical protein
MLVNPRNVAVVLVAFSSFVGCKEKESVPDPPASGSPTSSAAPVASAPLPKATSTATSFPEEKESADTWLVVKKVATELGVIELRDGKPLKLTLTTDNADATALKEKLAKVGGPDGIGLDMHMPPPSGKGRGPYGTQMVKPGERLYRHALKEELEPEYSVREVQQLIDPLPPPKLARLTVSRSGARVGTIDFTSTPPKLTTHSEVSEATGMKNDLELVEQRGEIELRYHHEKDGVSTLETVQAKPGDAHYAQTVALFLMVERSYRARYAYELEFTPAK